jgi:hypothetical protein
MKLTFQLFDRVNEYKTVIFRVNRIHVVWWHDASSVRYGKCDFDRLGHVWFFQFYRIEFAVDCLKDPLT